MMINMFNAPERRDAMEFSVNAQKEQTDLLKDAKSLDALLERMGDAHYVPILLLITFLPTMKSLFLSLQTPQIFVQ
ncbi:hypothetical protein [Pedobacter hiemivivus]|uniref:Uncharacterized protein n=1 Tax=Pedobacter hiemivivus TaxID=2530454 RepID=A0A4R0MZG3_9SPHI|nr:hypothetical protein [Pedobacter hiemivivus]TCC92730.1 hypothetical protein EZ444_18520 [Pedobacter hiemivivus]